MAVIPPAVAAVDCSGILCVLCYNMYIILVASIQLYWGEANDIGAKRQGTEGSGACVPSPVKGSGPIPQKF